MHFCWLLTCRGPEWYLSFWGKKMENNTVMNTTFLIGLIFQEVLDWCFEYQMLQSNWNHSYSEFRRGSNFSEPPFKPTVGLNIQSSGFNGSIPLNKSLAASLYHSCSENTWWLSHNKCQSQYEVSTAVNKAVYPYKKANWCFYKLHLYHCISLRSIAVATVTYGASVVLWCSQIRGFHIKKTCSPFINLKENSTIHLILGLLL